MLEICNVHKTFNLGTINEKHALNGVNLKLDAGDFVTVIGGNGAGKSTVLNAVAGTWPVDEGSILIDGVDVTGLPEFKRAAFLGRVFQDPMTGTTATMQIDENLALAARRGQRRGLSWGITKKEKERYHELLKELDLGLEDRMTSKVGLLSGGQRQAVTLLMASLQKPKLLLLDEHTAALDPKTAAKVLTLTDKIIKENNLTAMMVTHNMRDAIAHGNRLFLSNHDQPRSVSKFGNDSDAYREVSAKLLATCLHMMQGTPYVYQGEELGMCNAYFDDLADYRDIESLNAYKELTETCGVSHEEMMGYLKRVSRDNARTPMQWDDSKNAGFTTGTPWIKVNPNYIHVNAKQQVGDPDSVFSYYQKLIRLRHENEIIVYGDYELLEPENEELFIYTRTLGGERLMVLCNFTDRDVVIPASVTGQITDAQIMICNYVGKMESLLRPYESRVYRYEV